MSSIRQVAREARLQRLRMRFLLVALGALAVLALFTARPLMRWWQAMQSGHHLAQARAAVERQDFMAALNAVQQTASLTPQDAEMLRTAVQVLAGLNAPPDEILSTIQRVEHAGGMTPEMHLRRAQAQLLRGDTLAAQQALSALTDAQRQSWEVVELEATLLLSQGRSSQAAERLQSTPVTDSPQEVFHRAMLDLALSQGAQRTSARQIIWQTARSAGPEQKLALTLLSRDADLTAAEADELLRLTDHIDAPGLRQTVLAQVFRRSPERKTALIAAETGQAAKATTEQQVSFLLFLAKQQAPQAMLDFLRSHGAALAKQCPADYVNLTLEAYAKLKDWHTVKRLLESKDRRHLSGLAFNLWQACTLAALEPGSASVLEHLQLAYQITDQSRDRTGASRVADTALNLGQPAFAATCYEELAALPMPPADKITLLEKACHAWNEARDTAALRRSARALADQTPGHLAHEHRAIYLDLLCGEPLENIVPRLNAESATDARPRLLWAIIYERRGQTNELRRELAGLENAISWSPGQRAVLAGLLAKAGEAARAFQLVEKLPAALLLLEEAAYAKMVR